MGNHIDTHGGINQGRKCEVKGYLDEGNGQLLVCSLYGHGRNMDHMTSDGRYFQINENSTGISEVSPTPALPMLPTPPAGDWIAGSDTRLFKVERTEYGLRTDINGAITNFGADKELAVQVLKMFEGTRSHELPLIEPTLITRRISQWIEEEA